MEDQRNSPGLIDRIEAEATDTVHPILKWILEHIKLLGAGAALLLLVVGGYSGFTYYQETSRTEDQNSLGLILAQNQGESLTKELQEYIASDAHYRNKAMLELARTQMASGDFTAAAATWEQLSQTTMKDLRTIALMGKARSLSLSGSPKDALTLLLELRSDAPLPFQDSLNLQISEAAELTGDLKTALSAYESLKQTAREEANAAFYEYKIATLKNQIG
jgi:predicted negative regulator of RcsB-dependent stress response